MFVCCECRVLSGRGLCDGLITRPEESYRLWCVVVCDQETSQMRRPGPALGRSANKNKNTATLSKPSNQRLSLSHITNYHLLCWNYFPPVLLWRDPTHRFKLYRKRQCTYTRNIAARSRNHSKCASPALITQHASSMLYFHLWPVEMYRALHCCHKWHDFLKKKRSYWT